jgi:hypothetical protein
MPQIVHGRQTGGRLNRDELYVNLGCFRKCAQIAGIRGEDVVAVGCEAYHSGINGIGLAAAGKQHPGSPSQPVVDGSDVGAGQERRPAGAAAPGPATTPPLVTGGRRSQCVPSRPADPRSFPTMQVTAEQAGDAAQHGQVILSGIGRK